MNPTIQAIIAGAIVAAAVIYALTRLFRRKNDNDCACGCDGCPLTGKCDKPANKQPE